MKKIIRKLRHIKVNDGQSGNTVTEESNELLTEQQQKSKEVFENHGMVPSNNTILESTSYTTEVDSQKFEKLEELDSRIQQITDETRKLEDSWFRKVSPELISFQLKICGILFEYSQICHNPLFPPSQPTLLKEKLEVFKQSIDFIETETQWINALYKISEVFGNAKNNIEKISAQNKIGIKKIMTDFFNPEKNQTPNANLSQRKVEKAMIALLNKFIKKTKNLHEIISDENNRRYTSTKGAL